MWFHTMKGEEDEAILKDFYEGFTVFLLVLEPLF